MLTVPGVIPDLFYPVTLNWVSLQNLGNEMGAVGGEEPRQFILASHYFFVQIRSLWVFKGQETAHHSIKYDTTTPNVTLESHVLLSSYHFRSCVAGRTACCF